MGEKQKRQPRSVLEMHGKRPGSKIPRFSFRGYLYRFNVHDLLSIVVFAKHLGSFLVSIFKEAPINHDPRVTLYYLNNCLTLILTTSLPLLGAVGFVGILVGFLVVGPTFSTEVLNQT